MDVSEQLHSQAALTLGKEFLVPTGLEPAWVMEQVWVLQRREKSLTPARNCTQFLGHPASSLVPILTELSCNTNTHTPIDACVFVWVIILDIWGGTKW
jgi:hypothetical protein